MFIFGGAIGIFYPGGGGIPDPGGLGMFIY
jgi:hypothetical protein